MVLAVGTRLQDFTTGSHALYPSAKLLSLNVQRFDAGKWSGASLVADAMLDLWVKRGWAVVKTDYEGLGTPGVPPYLVGESEGRSGLDAVLAGSDGVAEYRELLAAYPRSPRVSSYRARAGDAPEHHAAASMVLLGGIGAVAIPALFGYNYILSLVKDAKDDIEDLDLRDLEGNLIGPDSDFDPTACWDLPSHKRPKLNIRAFICVERDSQKSIIIGKGGSRLREIGSKSRPEIERLLGSKVFLSIRVKVAPDWQRDPKQLGKLGF